MNQVVSLHKHLLLPVIMLSLYGALYVLMTSSSISLNEELSLAITIDLLLTIPLVYFLLIRKRTIPNTTVVPVMIVGLLIGSYALPLEHQGYLNLFKNYALPIVEISILTFIILKVRRVMARYRQSKEEVPDFFTTLKQACFETLPKRLAWPIATEVAVMYYGFLNWKTRQLAANEFSYHQRSGTGAVFGALMFIILVETLVIHLLLQQWSEVAAWVLTGLSLYTIFQLLGFARSLSQRPISMSKSDLFLRYGIMKEARIPLSEIDRIELSRKSLEKVKCSQKLSLIGDLESHNVIIHLNRTNEVTGLYGIKKEFRTIGLHLDRPKEFKLALEQVIPSSGDEEVS